MRFGVLHVLLLYELHPMTHSRTLERFGLIGALPGKLDIVAAKVIVGGGLAITMLVSAHDCDG